MTFSRLLAPIVGALLAFVPGIGLTQQMRAGDFSHCIRSDDGKPLCYHRQNNRLTIVSEAIYKAVVGDAQTVPSLAGPPRTREQTADSGRRGTIDCSKQFTKRERIPSLICSTPHLRALDQRLSAALEAAKNDPFRSSAIPKQESWASARDTCHHAKCVEERYTRRLAELEPQDQSAAIAALGAPGQSPHGTAAGGQTGAADRLVWEGRYTCNHAKYVQDIVVFGTIKQPSKAYLLIDRDKFATGGAFVNPVIASYDAAFDDILSSLNLKFRQSLLDGHTAYAPRQLELVVESEQRTLRGRVENPPCAYTLQQKTYPRSLIAAIEALQKDPASSPPVTISKAPSYDLLCLAASAWANQLKSSMPDRKFDTGIGNDPASQIFKASVMHPAFAQKYTGRDLSTLAVQDKSAHDILSGLKSCSMNPLFFENHVIFNRVFVAILSAGGLGTASAKLAEIQDRANRVGASADQFSLDSTGLARLAEYLAPMEKELASAVPETRDAILGPALKRQSEIAAAMIESLLSQIDQSPSLDRLDALATAAALLKGRSGPFPNSAVVVGKADAAIEANLEKLLNAQFEAFLNEPPTVQTLSRLKAHQQHIKAKYEKLAVYSGQTRFAKVLSGVDSRTQEIQAIVERDLSRQVSSASNVGAIEAILTSIEDLQKVDSSRSMMHGLRSAYRQGLREWFGNVVKNAPPSQESIATITTHSPPIATSPSRTEDTTSAHPLGALMSSTSPQAGSSPPQIPSPSVSVFTSPELKEQRIVSSIYKKEFAAIYADQGKAFFHIYHMLTVFGPACPGLLSPKFVETIMTRAMGTEKLDLEKGGWNVLLRQMTEIAQMTKDPNGWVREQLQDGHRAEGAKADAVLILQSVPCQDLSLKTFIANAEEFFVKPSAGVPMSELAMKDLCIATNDNPNAAMVKYCTCVGPLIDSNLATVEKSYIRLDPRRNLPVVLRLVQEVRSQMGRCYQ